MSVASAARGALERSGGPIGIAVAAAPTVAFVVTDALGGLTWAFLALAGTASAAFGVRLARRESVRGALVGLAVAAACAVLAAVQIAAGPVFAALAAATLLAARRAVHPAAAGPAAV
jgi:hypothetical protein